MRKLCRIRIVGAALLAGIFSLGGGLPASAGQYVLADRQTVTNPELDAMRGGYITDSGFQLSLGIVKAVIVDGALQTVSSLSIPNLANRGHADTVTIVQNYASQILSQQGNQMPVSQAGGSTNVENIGNLTLIQNSANQKGIQIGTVVNMTTNSLSMFRQLNSMSNIRQQFINMLH
jgi:hypothetical protein